MAVASVLFLSNYRTGSDTTYPVVMFSPYPDWEKLCIRCETTTANIGIGLLVYQDTATDIDGVTENGALGEACVGIVPDTLWNRRLIEEQNNASWAKYGTYKFDANTKIDVLPLIPGMILSVPIDASVTIAQGQGVVGAAGGITTPETGNAADDAPLAIIGRYIGVDVASGTGNPYVAMVVH